MRCAFTESLFVLLAHAPIGCTHRLLLLLLLLPLVRQPPARFPAIQCSASKHQRRSQHHHRAELMSKDDRAEDKADKLPDVQHNRHRDCGRLGREEVDARDARELRARVEE